MTPLKFPLYLTGLFLWRLAQMTNLQSSVYVQQKSGFYPANVGDDVTLRCFYEGNAVMFYWYKQTLGQKPRLISTFFKRETNGTFLNEFENNSRFTLEVGNGKNHLTITDLHISDSATYYCIGCYVYDFEFIEGATISVRGSGSNFQTLVHQSVSGTIQPGGSVTLNCTVHTGTCDGEHSVYWFKDSEESHPGLMYTHGDRNDQRKPETETHTCVYNLPMKSLNLSHAEIHYCAVVSCGHILFGNRKKLGPGSADGHSLVLVYLLSGALAFTTILAVLLAYAAYTMNNRTRCQQIPDSQARYVTASTPDYQDSESLHYAALRKFNRPARQRYETQNECVYSSVKQ